MPDGEDASGAEAEQAEFERKMEEAVEAYHRLAKQTQNQVYAWLALVSRGWVLQSRRRRGLPTGDLQIPAWCADYFTEAAQALTFLASGSDVRLPPEEMPGKQLTPAEAVQLVPWALGLTDRGFNAFGTFRTSQEDMQVFNRMEELREQGKSVAESLGILAREFGVEDESSVRKRVTRGRRFKKGDQPEDGETSEAPGET